MSIKQFEKECKDKNIHISKSKKVLFGYCMWNRTEKGERKTICCCKSLSGLRDYYVEIFTAE